MKKQNFWTEDGKYCIYGDAEIQVGNGMIPNVTVEGLLFTVEENDKPTFFDKPYKIIKSGLATICIWPDGTKTVVKCAKDETYSLYNAVASAIAIKIFGSNSAFKRMIEQTVTVQTPKKEKKNGRSAE